MYNPLSDESLEWIELHNQLSVDVELSGWTLEGAVDYEFPAGVVLSSGEYLVVASDPAQLQTQHDNTLDDASLLGPFTGRLANSGERLELRNHTDRLMSELEYDDGSGLTSRWTPGADGSGASLAKLSEFITSSDAGQWTSSRRLHGTPGAQNFPELDTLDRTVLLPIDSVWKYDASGEPPVADWASPGFDDASWSEGPALLFNESSRLPAEKATELPLGAVTFYFRSSFDFDPSIGDADALRLRLNHVVDDGAVFYINGVEVDRYRMPEGPIDHETLASRSISNGSFQLSSDIDLDLLQPGANTIAVEVHQTPATSNDVAFGLEVIVDQRVVETTTDTDSLQFTEFALGPDASWVELRNTGSTSVALAGWQVVTSNGERQSIDTIDGNTAIGPGERLVVAAEDTSRWREDDRLFLIHEPTHELADAVRLVDGVMGRVDDAIGVWQHSEVATPGAANRFEISDQIVINEIMYHAPPTYATPDVFAEEQVLAPTEEWRFSFAQEEILDSFARPDFDDSTWSSAPGIFFRETSDLPWPKTTPVPEDLQVMFFRRSLDLAEGELEGLSIRHLVDDGAVFFVNGIEVHRHNIDADPLTLESRANRSIANASLSSLVDLPAEVLKVGENILAVAVYQRSASSNDAVFGMEVVRQSLVEAATPFTPSEEEWIELYNRGTEPVDLSGWQLAEAVRSTFPEGTTLDPGQYGVVAWNDAAMSRRYPDARVLAEFDGGLSNSSDRIVLLDAASNIADEVHYFEGGYWPEAADGGGASLELRDPDADNGLPGSWASSDSATDSEWQHVNYVSTVQSVVHDPPINFHEFVMGMLDDGEVLLDNLSVLEHLPDGKVELIQNGSFSDDSAGEAADKWRALGTHNTTRVVTDPDDPTNQVLHLRATGRANYLSNHVETTLANGAEVEDGRTYEISFDAKWLSGSPQLRTELYYKDAAQTTILVQPSSVGTPGAKNSVVSTTVDVANVGPGLTGMRHSPVVPGEGDAVTVRIEAADPEGIRDLTLLYRVDEESEEFSRVEMVAQNGNSSYVGLIPPQADESLVQFFVEATDTLGEVSWFPPRGPESRALYEVDNSFELNSKRHTIQSLMLKEDVDHLHDRLNMIDNHHRGVTVVYNGADVYYDAGTRLRGSMFSRQNITNTGYNVAFRDDQLFRGVYESIAFDQGGENEIVVKFTTMQSGHVGGTYDDVLELQTPSKRGGGPTLVYLARHGDLFLAEQFGEDAGTLFKFEGVRVLTSTVDGEPESPKLYQPIGWVGSFDIQDLGNDKEQYRWPFLINGNRAEDDYTGIIRMAKAFSSPDETLEEAALAAIDIDTWTHSFAIMSLFGIGDAYTQGNPHNLNLYAGRDGAPVMAFPWDWDFVFNRSAQSPLHGGKNFGRILDTPTFEHWHLGYLEHLISTVFNVEYLGPWADHLGDKLDLNLSSIRRSVEGRVEFVQGEFPPPVPFVAGVTDFGINETVLLNADNDSQFLVPSIANGGDQLGDAWTQRDFVPDASWREGKAAIGFAPDSSALNDHIQTQIEDMRGNTPSFFMRVPFQLNELPTDDSQALFLEMQYEDGFAAFLNGVRVANGNAPDELNWQADATSSRRTNDAVEPARIDISEFKHLLNVGENVLAIHGLNSSPTSNDVMAVPRLVFAEFDIETPNEPLVSEREDITLQGIGWINIKELRIAGEDQPLPLRWKSESVWEVTIPLQPGEQTVELQAYDFGGELVASHDLTVTSTLESPVGDSLRITELMYHPADPTPEEAALGFGDDDDFEFIELLNVNDQQALDLTGLQLAGGVDFTFPVSQVGPMSRVVLARNPDAFRARYPDVPNDIVFGPYSGRLSNGGEVLQLQDAFARDLLALRYDDGDVWPASADGNGASLIIKDVMIDRAQWQLPSSWRASVEYGGSPGSASEATVGVYINEVLAAPTIDGFDSIELHNASDEAVDLGGWYVSDSGDVPLKYRIPEGTVIGPNGYWTVDARDFGGESTTAFGLSGTSGDEVWLTRANGEGVTHLVDNVRFGASMLGESWGRVALDEALAPTESPTLGRTNSRFQTPSVFISEIGFSTTPSAAALAIAPGISPADLAFVEITNATDSPADLAGWQLLGPLEFEFSGTTILEPGQSIVVSSFEPSQGDTALAQAFAAHYGIDEPIAAAGGMSGRLPNDFGRLELRQPTDDGTRHWVVDTIRYQDGEPWPSINEDAQQTSLQRVNRRIWGALADAWEATVSNAGAHPLGLLPGDVNQDGRVTPEDIDRVCAEVNALNPDLRFDWNGDQLVDIVDHDFFIREVIGSPLGDANLDGVFDSSDLVAIFRDGIYESAERAGWATGDWNCDGVFNSGDLDKAFRSGNYRPN